MAGKWVRRDRRYRKGFRWTPQAYRVFSLAVTLVVLGLVLPAPAGALLLVGVPAAGGTGYVILRVLHRSRAPRPLPPPATGQPLCFSPPPGWPRPPAGWAPGPGWRPDPSWPPAPAGWQFWAPAPPAPSGERNSRHIPQDVKIAVSTRDGGRCRQCGSTQDLHYDHVIPWSRGGAATAANVQLLCGPCNRRKGARTP